MDKDNMALCEKLWAQYEPRLRVICEVKLKSMPDEIDDVISEVFTALCERLEKYGLPDNMQTWLYGTLNNKINLKYREIYQKRENEQALSEKEIEVPYEQRETVIDEKIDEIYNDEIKARLLELLHKDEYELIVAVYYEHMTHREIALKTGTTAAAIKQKHYRIMKKLRNILNNSKKLF